MANFDEIKELLNSLTEKITSVIDTSKATIDKAHKTFINAKNEYYDTLDHSKEIFRTINETATAIVTTSNEAVEDVTRRVDMLDEIEDAVNDYDTNETVIGVCDECGEDVLSTDDYSYDADGNLFCSAECEEEYHTIGECEYCGTPIYDGDDYYEDEEGNLFCSDECQEDYENATEEEEEEPDEE